jgi:hypothetical protein
MADLSKYKLEDIEDCSTALLLLPHDAWVSMLAKYMETIEALKLATYLSEDDDSYERIKLLFLIKVKKDDLAPEEFAGKEYDLSVVSINFDSVVLDV